MEDKVNFYCNLSQNYNVEEKDLQGEHAITGEHVQNNLSVRGMLGQRGIRPEELPPSEDIKKLERRVRSQEKNWQHKQENCLNRKPLRHVNGSNWGDYPKLD